MSATAYECSPDVKWVVETFGILIVDPQKGAYCSLPYPSAAVWDLVIRGYSPSKIATMMQYIGGFPETAAAENYVTECLVTWANAGWLRRVGGDAGV
jgi:hypothetical protein